MILWLLVNTAIADTNIVSYVLGRSKIDFVRHPGKPAILLSKNCVSRDCMAYKALAGARLPAEWPRGYDGMDPGAAICRDVSHGVALTGRDSRGAQKCFCSFTDQSLVNCGALTSRSRLAGARLAAPAAQAGEKH